MADLVPLLTSGDRSLLDRARAILEESGVPAHAAVETYSTLYAGILDAAMGGARLMVPGDAVEEANRILCEQGIRCPVPAGMVERIVKRFDPAQEGGPFDPERVLRLLEELTPDARHALLRQVCGTERGAALVANLLLTSLLTSLLANGEDVRRDLTLALDEAGAEDLAVVFEERIGASSDAAVRRRFARVLARVKDADAARLLAGLLGNEDLEVREEAFDGLFFLSGGIDFGFDPEGPPEERAKAVARWRDWATTWTGDRRKRWLRLALLIALISFG